MDLKPHFKPKMRSEVQRKTPQTAFGLSDKAAKDLKQAGTFPICTGDFPETLQVVQQMDHLGRFLPFFGVGGPTIGPPEEQDTYEGQRNRQPSYIDSINPTSP